MKAQSSWYGPGTMPQHMDCEWELIRGYARPIGGPPNDIHLKLSANGQFFLISITLKDAKGLADQLGTYVEEESHFFAGNNPAER